MVALTTEDEDVDQTYTYDLINDPSGLFSLRNGILVASRSFDYESEESTEFDITVKSTDDGRNGQPLSVRIVGRLSVCLFMPVLNCSTGL